MSHPRDVRLRLLELSKPIVQGAPDVGLWIERAKALEAYVMEAGQAEAPAQLDLSGSTSRPDNRQSRPGNRR